MSARATLGAELPDGVGRKGLFLSLLWGAARGAVALVGTAVMAVALVIGYVVLLWFGGTYHWGWNEVALNYNLSFQIEYRNQIYTGSTVVSVNYVKKPSWQTFGSLPGENPAQYRGQAAVLALPDGRVVFMLVGGEAKLPSQRYVHVAGLASLLLTPPEFKAPTMSPLDLINAENATQISGFAEIPADRLPSIVVLDNPKDPRSAHLLDPSNVSVSLGSKAEFMGATISVTDEPASTGIKSRFPWLKAGNPVLTNMSDAFARETSGRRLYQADFY